MGDFGRDLEEQMVLNLPMRSVSVLARHSGRQLEEGNHES